MASLKSQIEGSPHFLISPECSTQQARLVPVDSTLRQLQELTLMQGFWTICLRQLLLIQYPMERMIKGTTHIDERSSFHKSIRYQDWELEISTLSCGLLLLLCCLDN